MTKTFTHETLIRYVYDDLPETIRRDVEAAMAHDRDLAAECAELLHLKAALDDAAEEPPTRVTNAILAAAKRG